MARILVVRLRPEEESVALEQIIEALKDGSCSFDDQNGVSTERIEALNDTMESLWAKLAAGGFHGLRRIQGEEPGLTSWFLDTSLPERDA